MYSYTRSIEPRQLTKIEFTHGAEVDVVISYDALNFLIGVAGENNK